MINDLSYKGTSISAWVQTLKSADAEARNEAVESLVEVCTTLTALLPALIEGLKEANVVTRAQTAATLGDFGGRIAAVLLVLRSALRTTVLTTDDADVRSAAAEALVQIGPYARSPLPVLIDNLKDELSTIRMTAANALAEMGPSARDAMPNLTSTALHDPVFRVRLESAVAIWRIERRPLRVVPVLIEALKNSDEIIRWIAADCLGDIGADARDAIPALNEALNLSYKTRLIRTGVVMAIERIELALASDGLG